MEPITASIRTALDAAALVAPGLAGRCAYAIFCRPVRRGELREVERETHRRATVESVVVAGKKVVTYRWGEGARPVLMLHGWRSRGSRYFAFVPGLQALGFTPISFDAPGHGDSAGPSTTILECRAVIRQLYERFGRFEAVIAHSFGVSCAFLALRGGVTARRLVTVSGVCDFGFLVEAFCGRLGLGDRVKRELRLRIEQQLPGETDVWRRFSAWYRPAEIAAPILVVHDRDDRTVGFDQAQKIAAAYGPRATLLATQGLGHRRMLSDPGVVAAVLAFLAAS